MLLFRGHLAEPARKTVWNEDRIIAEAIGAARRKHEPPIDPTLEIFNEIIGPGESEGADEMRAPRLRRVRREQFPLDSRHRPGEILGSARPARGINARRAAQSL